MWTRRWRFGVLWVAAFTVMGLLEFTYHYLDVLTRGRVELFSIPLIEEMTAAYGAAVLFPPAIALVRRARAGGGSGWRLFALYAAILPLFSALHTTWNFVSRSIVFPVVGLGPYDYGRMPLRYAM